MSDITAQPKPPLLFVGDCHGEFDAVTRDAIEGHAVPGTLVFVGDQELFGPANIQFGDLRRAGWNTLFILGNHDADTHQQYNWLMSEKHGGIPESFIGNRVVDIDGVKVAGLSGVFKGRIWDPKEERAPRYETRSDWIRRNAGQLWKSGLPPHMLDVIFPEDVTALRAQQCDVLVVHEGPSSVWKGMGYPLIDELAKDMGAKLIVHGHHHYSQYSTLPNGIGVMSLGKRKMWQWPQP